MKSARQAISRRLGYVAASTVLLALGLGSGCGDDSGEGGGGEGAGSAVNLTPASGGIRRLTGSQMQYSLEYLLGAQAALGFEVWDDQQLSGFESIAAAELAIGANDVSTLELEVRAAVAESLLDVTHIGQFAPCVVSEQSAACYEEVAAQFGRVAWRRPLDADEKAKLVNIATAAQTWGAGDFDTGLQYQLMAILQSPHFVYIEEIGEGDSSDRALAPYELASRMSFFLLHRTPDVELLDAAEAGDLKSDGQIRAQAQRMLVLPEARRSLDRFFSELYFIADIPAISKDAALYPGWNDLLARAMQEEMLRFLQDVVWTRDADARQIFTSQTTFVNATLAAFYGVSSPASGWEQVELPKEEGRYGLVGKPGFLARFSHPAITSPTRRGRFFRERLLCNEIPPPPADVDTTLPVPTEPKTMRERLEPHSANAQCSGCHNQMDPIGLAYEHFDAMGQYRADDNGEPIITADTSGELEFDGPEQLSAILAENGAACLVQNFWRQSMGHLETEGEVGALDAVETAFAKQGFSVQSMMVELVASEGFKRVGDPK